MSADVFLSGSECKRLGQTLLGRKILEYFDDLLAKGYSWASLRWYCPVLLPFSEFLDEHRIRDLADVPTWADRFIAARQLAQPRLKIWRSTIRRFIDYLVRAGQVPDNSPTSPSGPFNQVIVNHTQALRDERGACSEGIYNVRLVCRAFAEYAAKRGLTELSAVTPMIVHAFITEMGTHYSRKTMSGRCSALRGFLTHLYRRGITSTDLSPFVVAPRLYRHEECPRYITDSQIRSVLTAVDRKTAIGRRDYAMLLMLATYGLRGREVIRLTLDDIDWRHNRLRIGMRKAGNTTFYPLTPEVGDAILAYLQDGRPKSQSRRMFLSLKAPFLPLAYTAALGIQVRKYMALAGVQVERPGTHTFRYSCAQRLFANGLPLKTIGDFLGHRTPDSTQRYTKIAIEQLREVALGDGEDLL